MSFHVSLQCVSCELKFFTGSTLVIFFANLDIKFSLYIHVDVDLDMNRGLFLPWMHWLSFCIFINFESLLSSLLPPICHPHPNSMGLVSRYKQYVHPYINYSKDSKSCRDKTESFHILHTYFLLYTCALCNGVWHMTVVHDL